MAEDKKKAKTEYEKFKKPANERILLCTALQTPATLNQTLFPPNRSTQTTSLSAHISHTSLLVKLPQRLTTSPSPSKSTPSMPRTVSPSSSMVPSTSTGKRVQACPIPVHFRDASAAMQLLNDLALDVPLPWLHAELFQSPSKQSSIPPALSRTLISILLRAASHAEADAVYEALLAVVALPESSPCACLGFSAEDVAKEDLTSVLCELVSCAAREEPLLVSGEVLQFYSEAGHGAADSDEYHAAIAERRDVMGAGEVLREVRVSNLARTLDIVARSFERGGRTTQRLMNAVKGNTTFVNLLVTTLPARLHLLNEGSVKGLRRLYQAYMAMLEGTGRQSVVTKLVGSFMGLAAGDIANLPGYMQLVGDADIRFRVCRVCLVQRFKVKDRLDSKFGLAVLESYLRVLPRQDRPNHAVPLLLGGLITSWMEIAEANEFCTENFGLILKKWATLSKTIAGEFNASKADVGFFRTAMLALSNLVLVTK